MVRPILGTPSSLSKATTASRKPATSCGVTGPRLERLLRRPRSEAYMRAMTQFDAHAHEEDKAGLKALLETIGNEFPELAFEQMPIGYVGRCYLGKPYEVHIFNLKGEIVEHYETFRPMPPLFERARTLALHPSYAFIEVYTDTLRPVLTDGSVSSVAL